MTQGVAEAGAAAVALPLPKVASSMVALTEARLTGEAVGPAPEVASEVVVVMPAGLRNIGAGAVEPFIAAPTWIFSVWIHSFPFHDSTHSLGF